MHFAAVFFESYRKRLFLRRERNYMPNFIFISPAFPGNYENFCVALRANGVNVLGIGDTPYDCLSPRLKSALTEYYRVENMENYDEMFRAVAFLSFHHGKIDIDNPTGWRATTNTGSPRMQDFGKIFILLPVFSPKIWT